MIIYLLADPIENSYIISLIEEYKRAGHIVYSGTRNFLTSNLVPDVLHIQWPEKIYNNYPFSALQENEKLKIIEQKLQWFKNNNTIIIHTIHNLQPHNSLNITFERNVYNLTISYSDILIHHCSKSIELLKSLHPEVENRLNIIANHPDYLYDYVKVNKEDARKKLGLPSKNFIILNFGSQQKYKGEDFIETVFSKLPMKDKYLFTAGNYVYEGNSNKFVMKLRNRYREKISFKNKKYIYKRISADDLPYIISSSDILFLAHKKGSLNSGILPLAATYNKPVVFPNIGCFNEQMKNWTFESYNEGDDKNAIEAITKIYNDKIIKQYDFNNTVWLRENSWESHVKVIMESIIKNKSNV